MEGGEKMNNMKLLHMVAFALLVVGGVNWGLIGLGGFMGSNWNLVNMVLGTWPTLEWVVYVLVGVSGLYLAATHMSDCKVCSKK